MVRGKYSYGDVENTQKKNSAEIITISYSLQCFIMKLDMYHYKIENKKNLWVVVKM